MVTAVYPGTFDPLTRGHEDLVHRASGLFDRVIVGVADSKKKEAILEGDVSKFVFPSAVARFNAKLRC